MTQRYQVPAIRRAFEVVELLATQDSGVSISELHRQLHLPLSSAASIVYTLKDLGYLERDEVSSRYSLSVKMFGIARRAHEKVDLVSQCHGLLEEAVRKSGLTGHLSVLRGCESMYVDRVQSKSMVQIFTYVGMRWPAHISAAGKALLAFLPEPELHALLRQMSLRKLTTHTITSKRLLEKQLQSFRRLGYTWERNEGEVGLGCLAAPVFGAHHKLVAALSLTGTAHQIQRAMIPSLGSMVKQFSLQMSLRLGDQSD